MGGSNRRRQQRSNVTRTTDESGRTVQRIAPKPAWRETFDSWGGIPVFGSLAVALVVVAVLVLAFVGWLVFRPKAPAKPDACQRGNLAQCTNPSQRNTSKTKLPGGFDPATGDSKDGSSKDGSSGNSDSKRLERCLNGVVSACG